MNNMMIFNVGLPRTGTTSICRAFSILGLKSKHSPLSLDLGFYTSGCYADTPIWAPSFYKKLYEEYSNAKFICTHRPLDDWLRSCKSFFIRQDIKQCHPVDRFAYGEIFSNDAFPCNDVSFIRGYENHKIEVESFFEDKQDQFLSINITDKNISDQQKWDSLCNFVGVKNIPTQSFPCVGASKK